MGVIALQLVLGLSGATASVRAEGSLIPTRSEAQTVRGRAIARDLERSLGTLPGVARAQVHVTLPVTPAFAEGLGEAPRVSVLVHRAPDGKPDHEIIRRLVAGAVPALSPSEVVLVETATGSPHAPGIAWAQVGPFVVAATDAPTLRFSLAALLTVQAVLALLLLQRMRTRKRPEAGNLAADGGKP